MLRLILNKPVVIDFTLIMWAMILHLKLIFEADPLLGAGPGIVMLWCFVRIVQEVIDHIRS